MRVSLNGAKDSGGCSQVCLLVPEAGVLTHNESRNSLKGLHLIGRTRRVGKELTK